MHKSAQFRDFSQPWPERRKSYAQDTQKSIATTPARQNSDQTVESWRSIASSSSMVTVTRTVSGSSAVKLKQRPGTKQRRLPQVHVTLAEEIVLTEHSESESSCYDSLNEMETDFCRDESDCSDGYVTDGFATMDVFEYEVDDSSDSEDIYSHGSSSGTDDMVEVVAKALFASSSDSDDIEIFAQDADTEESDAPTDPELGRADYWTCIKCKNRKNNPMYRYCEKCYQIRKNHFPPRPKHRRKRASLGRHHRNNLLGLSSPSTSSSISIHDEKHDEDGRISRNSSDGSDGIGNEFIQKPKQMRKQRQRTTSHPQKHSAGESSCCSSQELSPDEQQSTLPSNYLVTASASSQETYCSDLEHIVNVNKQSNSNLFEHNYPNSQESVYPNSEPVSQTISFDNVYESVRSLSKLDSLASTISGYSVGSSQSSTDCDANGTQHAVVPELKTTNSFDGSTSKEHMAKTKKQDADVDAAAVAANKRRAKKRKIDFADEISDSDIDDEELMAKKFRAMEETDPTNGMCMICLSEPKNGAFVHNRFLHVCCCYRCTVKVWNKRKRCPICNSQVKTVLKMFVH
ncbi:E3 ubiquitin-protein ligase Mdm2-like [Sitodiplosis mosellana]|uniref:E3 ubiquitin-protein ligase Mdm2-like n=1 Tax=Sitodiplosis mosellana TaxID=263140 RepID=UPI0024439BA4|nr:E3 ubiquitin-protein ligase Mdm2-like [Sitodiplosis mosellana]